MKELLDALSKTPLPTVIAVVGIFLIMIALHFEFNVGVETSKVPDVAAGVVGTIFIILSIVIYVAPFLLKTCLQPPPERPGPGPTALVSHDSFFSYYVVSAVGILFLTWMIVAGTTGEIQHKSVRLEFGLIDGLIAILLIWRYWAARFYLRNRDSIPPIGLLEPTPNFIPYFILIGTAIIGLVGLIYMYTQPGTASAENRLLIIIDLVVFLFYLALARLVWEIIDLNAKGQLPKE
jgi:hypothetical protein